MYLYQDPNEKKENKLKNLRWLSIWWKKLRIRAFAASKVLSEPPFHKNLFLIAGKNGLLRDYFCTYLWPLKYYRDYRDSKIWLCVTKTDLKKRLEHLFVDMRYFYFYITLQIAHYSVDQTPT